MAFVLEVLPQADVTNEIRAALAPSEHIIVARDPRFASYTSFLPWHAAALGAAGQLSPVIGYDQLAGLFFDRLKLTKAVLPDNPSIEWTRLRVHCREFTRLLVVATAACMPALEYHDRGLFLASLDRALGSLDEWLPVDAASLEYNIPVDFNHVNMAGFKWLQPLEQVSVQQFRSGERTSGWGMLAQSMEPYWSLPDRSRLYSTFYSSASQWLERVRADVFAGQLHGVRGAMITDAAAQVICATKDWEGCHKPGINSVDREKEFVALLQLGSTNRAVRELAFGTKLCDIVRLDANAESYRRLMGRTLSARQLYTWYRSLCGAMIKDNDVFRYSVFKQVNKTLKERLAFLATADGKVMSDEQRVEEVINVKLQCASIPLGVYSGAAAEGGGISLSTRARNTKMKKLHLSRRHQEAVITIRSVSNKVGVSQEEVVAAVLHCGIPPLSQWILGKIELDGHKLYEECSKWRCVWHGDSDVEEVVGRSMANSILPAGQYPQFTLASKISLHSCKSS